MHVLETINEIHLYLNFFKNSRYLAKINNGGGHLFILRKLLLTL